MKMMTMHDSNGKQSLDEQPDNSSNLFCAHVALII
jgi:hypothetical protein